MAEVKQTKIGTAQQEFKKWYEQYQKKLLSWINASKYGNIFVWK